MEQLSAMASEGIKTSLVMSSNVNRCEKVVVTCIRHLHNRAAESEGFGSHR